MHRYLDDTALRQLIWWCLFIYLHLFEKLCHSRPLFSFASFFIFVFSVQFKMQLMVWRIFWWLDSNPRSPVSESTAIATEPQPLSKKDYSHTLQTIRKKERKRERVAFGMHYIVNYTASVNRLIIFHNIDKINSFIKCTQVNLIDQFCFLCFYDLP